MTPIKNRIGWFILGIVPESIWERGYQERKPWFKRASNWAWAPDVPWPN